MRPTLYIMHGMYNVHVHRRPAFKGPWGSIDAARQLHREAGFGAFWRGLAPRSLRCVLAVFVLGESQTLLDPLYERHIKRN